jgi:hypothetical protein
MSMPIAPAATPRTAAITTVTPPTTTPFSAQTHRAVWQLSMDLSPQKLLLLVAVVAAMVALAAPVHADVDTDFANQLHVYGVYGPRDQNAWLGKITCNRLGNGIDADAYKSAAFLSKNLPRGTATAQTWQFLNTAITTYCPNQMPVLTSAAGPRQ